MCIAGALDIAICIAGALDIAIAIAGLQSYNIIGVIAQKLQ
jgi:hypothetical protein